MNYHLVRAAKTVTYWTMKILYVMICIVAAISVMVASPIWLVPYTTWAFIDWQQDTNILVEKEYNVFSFIERLYYWSISPTDPADLDGSKRAATPYTKSNS